jgi:protein TonB
MQRILAVILVLGAPLGLAQAGGQKEGDSPKLREAPKVERVRVGGDVQKKLLKEKTTPVYPLAAMQARIQGKVKLHVIVGTDGSVKQLELISGPPELVQTSMDAVRKWKYRPTLLNGKAVEVDTVVDVIFEIRH